MHPSAFAVIAFDITEERVREAERRTALGFGRSAPGPRRGSPVARTLARAGVGLARLALRVDRSSAAPELLALKSQMPRS